MQMYTTLYGETRNCPPPPASSLLKLELKTQFAWKCFICKMVPEKETVVEGAKRRKRRKRDLSLS